MQTHAIAVRDISAPVARHDASLVLAALGSQTIQPITDVAAYLEERTPVPTYEGDPREEMLLANLFEPEQKTTKAALRACQYAERLVKDDFSIQAALIEALRVVKGHGCASHKTFRPKFEQWRKQKDWTVLVNRSKAPVAWRDGNIGLPEQFLIHCETKFGSFKRSDGKRQALLSIKRNWVTGRDEDGNDFVIPGYEVLADGHHWKKRDRENFPDGWHYTNIMRQIKARGKFTKGVRALLHDSESAARQFLPQNLGSRAKLRFLEKVTFDDVRVDWLVFNPATGQAEELWLLVARDEATAMVLGFVDHPASVREDGKAAHLGARQMKELAAYLLERFPLPPYLVHWVVERGTATLAEGVKAALAELFNNRIKVHYTSMIGDKSPVGYKEKAKGNSRGKGSHEAHNRLLHTMASHLPGQTGANYGIRPADLNARVRECQEIHERFRALPEEKRDAVKYPLLTVAQARVKIHEIFSEQNFRKEHNLEAFEEIVVEEGGKLVQRMEMPVERAVRLIGMVQKWDRVSPEIIRTFLEHSERRVAVEANGEIKFQHNGKILIFRNGGVPLAPESKALAYHHGQDPQFLHLTTGDGRFLGTWVQRGRGAYQDQEALAMAMRYTHAAREHAKGIASELAEPERAELEAMRASNTSLEQFITVTNAPAANGFLNHSAVGGAFKTVKTLGAEMKINPPKVAAPNDCTEELLKRAATQSAIEDENFD